MKIKNFLGAILLTLISIVYTLVIKFVDVQAIGPEGSSVGFASINKVFANVFTYNDLFYKFTKIIALFAFLYIGAFAVWGLIQLIKRKGFKHVELEIYGMGGLYVITMLLYALFEILVINYRPVITDGELEASFPSSHTMLAVAVFGSAIVYFANKLEKSTLKTALMTISIVLAAAMPIGRLISGVHWFTDILGGILYGCTLITLYAGFCKECPKKN